MQTCATRSCGSRREQESDEAAAAAGDEPHVSMDLRLGVFDVLGSAEAFETDSKQVP